jgi:hypothetical protein
MGQVRGAIRAVTHLDVSRHDIETALAAVRQVTSSPGLGTGQAAVPARGY